MKEGHLRQSLNERQHSSKGIKSKGMEAGGGEYLCRCPLYLCKEIHTQPLVFLCLDILNIVKSTQKFLYDSFEAF